MKYTDNKQQVKYKGKSICVHTIKACGGAELQLLSP